MPRRRDAACGRRRSGPAFPGSSTGLPGGVWSARWAVLMEGGYLAFWRDGPHLSWREIRFLRHNNRFNATTSLVSPSEVQSSRSQSAVVSLPLLSNRRRAPTLPRRLAKTPARAHPNIRHTSGHLGCGKSRTLQIGLAISRPSLEFEAFPSARVSALITHE